MRINNEKEMKFKTQIELASIFELIKAGHTKTAIRQLRNIDRTVLCDSDLALYNILLSEANISLGNHEVEEDLIFAIEYFRNTNEHEYFARAKYLLGKCFAFRGDLLNAGELIIEAYASFKRVESNLGQIMALNRLAYIAFHAGDLNSTLTHLNKCIALIDSTDSRRLALAKSNLAYYKLINGNIHDTLFDYDAIYRVIGYIDDQDKCYYHLNYSIPYALLADYPKAITQLEKARPYLDDYRRQKAIYHEYYGWILNLQGSHATALAQLNKGLKIGLEIAPESFLISQIKRHMADAYFGLKKYDLAAATVDEALVVATKLNERIEIAECHRIKGQLAVLNGEIAAARNEFEEAIDLLNMIGARYNLAAARYIAATSSAYRNGEKNAMLHLAREYFAGESVNHFIEKIDVEFTRSGTPVVPAVAMPDNLRIITRTPSVEKILEQAQYMAPTQFPILLTGPTGTGKDLLARYLHHRSGFTGEFVIVNIAAIPESMLEAELFGYKRGAFTSAERDKRGLIELAQNGTFYLNEVGEASPTVQSKLLDVLERRTIRPLGGTTEIEVNFRLIAATNRDLVAMIERNEFRADLYHRIRHVEMSLPPLSERPGDIELLIGHFLTLNRVESNPDDLKIMTDVFQKRQWSGNIRELRQEVERLIMVSDRNISVMARIVTDDSPSGAQQLVFLMRKCNNNRAEIARRLGLSEGAVRYRLQKMGL